MEVPKGYGRQNWAKVNAIDFVKPKIMNSFSARKIDIIIDL